MVGNETKFPFCPVIIIGAGRSGTNMLRDALCALPDFDTWPCDEINYIWRHGNRDWPTDEIPQERADECARNSIRAAFLARWHKTSPAFMVEKTCANSLRVPFVHTIVPEAKFVFIVRNGIDVVASARKRWTAELDIRYVLKKARFVPLSDLPYYATKYFMNRAHRLFDSEGRLSLWGPRFEGMDELSRSVSLESLCAWQWRRCVEATTVAMAPMPEGKMTLIRYEDFVRQPGTHLQRAADFLGAKTTKAQIDRAVAKVTAQSVGQGRRDLGAKADTITPIMLPMLEKYGYVQE